MKQFPFICILLIFFIVKSSPETIEDIPLKVTKDPGSPLILTPYIESGQIEEARDLARVEFPGFPQIRSYAGFFTVDKKYNSNLFVWYFPAKSYIKEQILILWLQGGPGQSGLKGLFNEHGPLKFNNGTFYLRPVNWTLHHSVIYIDNPVGSGFSFTNDSSGYCNDTNQVAEHLYSTLTQFFQMFPELKDHAFFIAGESYGGKFVPTLGYTIHKNNQESKHKINLKALMIGNGWSDPINQISYGDHFYQLGLIDWNMRKEIGERQIQITSLIKKEAWLNATDGVLELYGYIIKCTNISMTNYFLQHMPDEEEECTLALAIESKGVRKAIHVGNTTFHNSSTVFNRMRPDMMKSVAPLISELLNNYQMLFYNGQFDNLVPYPLTVNFLRKLNFSSREEYMKAERRILYESTPNTSNLIGYVKTAGNLTECLIRNAGHSAAADQPDWVYKLLLWWSLDKVLKDKTHEDK